MNEAAAREVLLVQAFETAAAESPIWTAEDRAWATRVALEAVGTETKPPTFIAERAHHALQRLAPREPAVGRWLGRRLWRPGWVVLAVLAGFVFGAVVDAIGSEQRINLLAPPVWGIVVWNLAVYLLLVWRASLAPRHRGAGRRAGALQKGLQRLLAGGPGAASAKGGGSQSVLNAFAATWVDRSAPLSAARAATLLHAAAAALAVGVAAGMYLRGLVLDYRAAWESTFLDASAVHALLSVLLGPAAALSGIALPDAAQLESLRVAHGVRGSAAAAPWIHLYALTLLLIVVLPRCLLAVGGALYASWLSRHFPLPLADVYFERLSRQQRGEVAQVAVVPYAQAPSAQAALGLRAVLAPVLGDTLQIHFAPTVAFGEEEGHNARSPISPGATAVIALFDLAATPEAENHGRLVELLRNAVPGKPVLMLLDEGAFRRRFGTASERLAERRTAWRNLGRSIGAPVIFVDLDAPDAHAVQPALQHALGAP